MRHYLFLLTRYMNALEVDSGSFASSVEKRVVLRKEEEFSAALKNDRESNCKDKFHVFLPSFLNGQMFVHHETVSAFPTVFILCGTPDDIMQLKNGSLDVDAHVAFILIDLYKSVIHQSLLFHFFLVLSFFLSLSQCAHGEQHRKLNIAIYLFLVTNITMSHPMML